ncbi:hypothetical protein UUU_26690 (plasmid) [Klebsiella pneumoniae subsp. pneumoniae DSM 30104 = JCM 1662 = NBRC 14940]|nr:hypothetical protein UUU_26690 [Klebsiella pneumoniae subsp. pneumoniae DSM 30104 = JCM 1662 = NBRC 14940]
MDFPLLYVGQYPAATLPAFLCPSFSAPVFYSQHQHTTPGKVKSA